MPYYVYIIQSSVDDSYYKGFSENPAERLCQHNNGFTFSTRHLIPWKLVYVEEFVSKSDALIRERNIKKATRQRIAEMIKHPKNIIHQFMNG